MLPSELRLGIRRGYSPPPSSGEELNGGVAVELGSSPGRAPPASAENVEAPISSEVKSREIKKSVGDIDETASSGPHVSSERWEIDHERQSSEKLPSTTASLEKGEGRSLG